VAACAVFTTFTWLAPIIRGLPFERIFRICIDEAQEKNRYAPKSVLLKPYYHAITWLKGAIAIIAIASFASLWIYLRLRGPRWEGQVKLNPVE
jgi:hypothetical protein